MEKNTIEMAQFTDEKDGHHRPWAQERLTSVSDEKISNTRHKVTHLELVRIIERMHRRYLDRLRLDLNRLGADDISPSQVMLLFTIGDNDLSVRDLLDRGHYLGSNASYSLKQLVQAGYVDRTPSQRDRRSARIKLTDKGKNLCEDVRTADEANQRLIVRNERDLLALQETVNTLRRLEVAWATGLPGIGPTDLDIR